MTAIGTSERHYLPEWALGAVDVCEIDAVMAADDEWRFGRSVPVRAGTPSSPLVETSDGTVGVNVYGVSAQIQEVFDLIDEGTQRSGVGRAPASTAPMAMC